MDDLDDDSDNKLIMCSPIICCMYVYTDIRPDFPVGTHGSPEHCSFPLSSNTLPSSSSSVAHGNHGNSCITSDDNDSRYDSEFYNNNYHEYEEGLSEPIVKGRLKASKDFWIHIGADSQTIDTVSNGYKLPFIHTPPPSVFKNNKSAFSHSEFVSEAVADLLSKGLVCKCSSVPDIINPLSVSVNSSGKCRLILDLRYVNQYLWKQKIKI